MDKEVCAVCRITGRHGARWILKLNDERKFVHRPCGRKIQQSAPKGLKVELFPTREMRDEMRVQRFWKDKFQEAEDRKKQGERNGGQTKISQKAS